MNKAVSNNFSLIAVLIVVTPAALLTFVAGCSHSREDAANGRGPALTPAEQQRIDPLTDNQKQALAYAAKAAGFSLKDHEAAIANYRLALKEEPNSRQWHEQLAFELWKAKRTPEATPIWKQLANGNDDIAKRSVKMLAKSGNAEAPKQ